MLLSIIIPIYNVEKYVRKTLCSISSQHEFMSDVEVIIVNDGTPDKSMEIVNSFTERIPNMSIINQENGGLSKARNTGLKHARGEYVWFVDSDDWLEKNSIRNVLNNLLDDCNQTDIFCYQIKEVTIDENVLLVRSLHTDTKRTTQGIDFLQSRISFAPMQQYVIRRLFLLEKKMFFVEGLLHEDIEFAPKMLIYSNRVCLVPIVSYCYLRRNDGNITGAKDISANRLTSLHMILYEYVDWERRMSDKLIKKCLRKIQKTAVLALYNFSSVSQIESNYLGAFDKEHVRLYKKVILNNLLSLNYSRFRYCIFDLIFLVSPKLYKRTSILLAK